MSRACCAVLTAAVLILPVRMARAQAVGNEAIAASEGSIDFGLRLTSITGDEARNQRYRDLRNGPTIARFRYSRDEQKWFFNAGADHAGYRDQRYFAEFRQAGKVKLDFEWNQIPQFNSIVTLTPYTTPSVGVFRIDDRLQQGVEAGTLKLSDVAAVATPFDLRSRRDVAAFNMVFTATRHIDLKLNVKSTKRDGQQQWGIGFGFSNQFEVAAPLDHRTTDVGSALEWANDRGMARVGYDGSYFHNNVESLIVDNPLRFTDTTSATSQGRMAFWPSSHSNTINAAGSMKFPARSQATAYVSVGTWSENAPLIPFTINPAITPIPLDRPTAEAEARVTAMNYTVSSHPGNDISLTARFKRYDFDNRTPHFAVINYVRTDQSVTASASGGSEALGYVRNNFEADASFTPIQYTAFRVGYAREEIDRTHRFLEKTTENMLRTSVDFSGNAYVTVRTLFEHSVRTGSGLDEQVLDDAGEQTSLRQFDISDRSRNRVSTILQLTPVSSVGITATLATGNDHRPDAAFGLQQLNTRTYVIGADYVPADGTSFGATYGYENSTSRQRSRTAAAGAQFIDPTRDWATLGFDRVNTANVSADLLKLVPSMEFRVAYDFNRSRAHYDYTLTPDTTLPAVSQLPLILNELQHGTFDARYLLRKDISVGLVYWYDRYKVDDFALGLPTLSRIDVNTGSILLGNPYLPYTFHTVSLRLNYIW